MLIDVSIIVPIYNTAKYLPQCLDSILKQKGLNLEIICVDDASTDNSKSILNKYKLKHPENIKVITNIKNMGFGYSMNIGIQAVTMPITYYVDSDDYLVENSLYNVCKQLKQTEVDFIQMKQCLFVDTFNNSRVYDFTEFMHFSIRKDNQFTIVAYPWSKLYKTSFLKRFRFTESPGASYQDLSFGGNVCFQAKSIGLYKEPVYAYRYNRIGNSSTYASMIKKVVFVRYEVLKFLYESSLHNIDMVKAIQYILDVIHYHSNAHIELGMPVNALLVQLVKDVHRKYQKFIISDNTLHAQLLAFYAFITKNS